MLGFNNNINVCNRFVTSIYLCYISRLTSHYVTKKTLRNKLYTYILYINDEAEIVNKDDNNDSDDKESRRQW